MSETISGKPRPMRSALLDRRQSLLTGVAAIFMTTAGVSSVAAQQAGDRIRKIVLATAAQAADPQEFQAAQLIAQEWRKLGLEVEVRGMPRPQVHGSSAIACARSPIR